ncbi:antibiotic biosynthesis monooxygenase [Cryobacterium adonitolivorans]|uniref:Antibiotic biosynthesis monooxygenase n=1 Tax=Cryobacterium adonitolivorans TaxID=1259189 RepID=A0A4R8VZ47_9MICO|nr:antibiotic biosynthesis monooxygenase family protein [Cryobacterium adonitolivorans]TFB96210.1 antibiotic biosynthesis monooxygenase [Cryobacterium adonitolivorans]
MSVVVVAVITPLEGHLQRVVDAFAVVAPRVHAEQGCELYALHHDADNVIMIERWSSPADLAAHAAGAPIGELNALLADHVEGPTDVSVLESVPLGESAKGTIQ